MKTIKIDEGELRKLYLEEDMSMPEIAKLLSCHVSVVFKRCKKFNIPIKKGQRKFKIGTKFANNNLVIIDYGSGVKDSINQSNRQTYIVKCNLCNNISEIRRSCLVQKSRRCCRYCMEKGTKNARWKGYGELSGSQFYVIKYSAEIRDLEFDISIEDAWKQYEKQQGLCALSGEEIKFNPEKGWVKRDITASLDRIDSNLGYTVNNIQWVSKDIQVMKMDDSQEEFINWCKKITDFQESRVEYSNPDYSTEFAHHKNWKGYGNIRSTMFTSYKNGAMKRNLSFDVTIQEIWNLYLEQHGLCAISGLPINFTPNYKDKTINTASLDRIDSSLGYTKNNVHWVHKRINEMKMDLKLDRLLELCYMVTNYNFGVY